MEKIINGEQLESEQALINEEENKENIGATTSQDSSQLGKFQSSEELLKAYNNLEAEFTRKCQKLSEIQKKISEKGGNETSEKDETKVLPPEYEREDWRSKVAVFLTENERAKGFSREISEEILKDPALKINQNMLDIAWARVLAKNYKSPDQIVSDSSFIQNYVLSNDEIKKQIINSYINEVSSKRSPFIIGSGTKGGMSLLTKGCKPSTLNDAKNLVEKMFK